MDDEFEAYTPEGLKAQRGQHCEKLRELARECGKARPDLSAALEAQTEKSCCPPAPQTILELDERSGAAMHRAYQWQLWRDDRHFKPK
jgi:hypothetical protein